MSAHPKPRPCRSRRYWGSGRLRGTCQRSKRECFLKCQHTQNLDRVAQDATEAVTHCSGSSVGVLVVQMDSRCWNVSHYADVTDFSVYCGALEQKKKNDMIHFLCGGCYSECAYKFRGTWTFPHFRMVAIWSGADTVSAHALNCTYERGFRKNMIVLFAAVQVNINWHLPTHYDKREKCLNIQFVPAVLLPNADQGLFIHEVSRSHNDAPQSVGLPWTSDQLVAETSTCQRTT